MSTIDQQFVEFIVKSLVTNDDKVEIVRTIDEKGVLLELTVDPEDLGRVIGKRGATAQSIRTLLRALGTKNEARYNLKIVDNGVPKPERTARDEEAPSDSSVSSDDSSSDDVASDDVSDDSADEPQEIPQAEDDAAEDDEEERAPSLADRTREELKDLDDLDI